MSRYDERHRVSSQHIVDTGRVRDLETKRRQQWTAASADILKNEITRIERDGEREIEGGKYIAYAMVKS